MQSSSVLILGARGRFGSAAMRAFVQAGWQVHAQVRPGRAGPVSPGVQWIEAESGDTATLAHAARGAGVVVHGLNPVYTHKAWRAQVPGLTRAAIDISHELGGTLMLPGNVYNFGDAMPAQLHEDTPQRADTVKGRLRIACERQIMEATRDGQMKAVVIRAGDFFGNGTGSWFDQMLAKDITRGKLSYPGDLDVPTAWAYLPDLARSFVRVAAQRDRLEAFELMHFAGHTLTGRDWAGALTDVAWEQGWLPLNGQLHITSMSWPLMRLVALAVPTVAALCEMRYLWRTPHALVNTRMKELIGDEPHTPLDDAVRDALGGLGLLDRPHAGHVFAMPSR